MLKRFLCPFLLLCTLSLYAADYTLVEDKAHLPILTPSLAKIKTAKIRLNNGLEAYIVSDPDVDKASAALTVKVGSWDDPEDSPGLSHFLEHLLFLGTKKYPDESEYDRFITEHGGVANAFTLNDSTSFIFEIDHSAFDRALDMFSNFFKEPLFSPSGVSRELNAIDQEFAKNLQNDNIREIYVLKELADAHHPFHSFSAGNSAALAKVSQETLKEYYHTHYSANLMRLMVSSSKPLDQLIELVVKDFKDVPNYEKVASNLEGPLFPPKNEKDIIYIEPIKNLNTLTLLWDLPAPFSHMLSTKPEAIVCYVLGDESNVSLLAQLKRENLAEELQCGSMQIGPNNTLFYISIDLTKEGVRKLNTVLERFYQTIAVIKEKGAPRYLFDEVRRMNLIRYQYKTRENTFQTIMKHATWLPREDLETYPEHTEVIQSFDPKAVNQLVNFLTPENAIIDLIAPSTLTGIKTDRKEKWNGVEYTKKTIPQEFLSYLSTLKPNPAIDLPAANPYLPENLSLVNPRKEASKTSIVPHPTSLLNNEKGKIYYAPDTQFFTPQIGWVFEIKTPYIDIGDPYKTVLGDLFVKGVKEALNTLTYPAQLAGLNYEMSRSDNGINLTVEGFSENADKLLVDIIKQLQDFQISEVLFKLYKDSQLREYQNFSKESPMHQASELLKSFLYKRFTASKEKAAALRKITYIDFQEYLKGLFEKVYVQGVLYGNLNEKEAKNVTEKVIRAFDSSPYPLSEHPKVEVAILPADKGPFLLEKQIKTQGNAALLAIEVPEFSLKKRAVQQVLMQAIGEPFFAELRTRQQTGYLVYDTAEDVERKLFNFFAVQSNSHDPRDLLARFEQFIEGYLQELKSEVPKDRYDKIKQGLLINLKQPAKNIKAMAELINQLAFKYDADFDWMEKRIASFNTLSYEEFLQMAPDFLNRENKRRLGILIKGFLPPEKNFSYQRLPNLIQLRQLSEYKPK